jgi:7,8-dihydropterin-6-yl-methyl-4-(beta-D-ribofuranosyl)aminobenzene 5'-phosphate synthase
MVRNHSASLCAGKTINSVITAWIRCLIVSALIPLGSNYASGEPTTRLMPTITVVYDNNPYREGLETAWGFSCLVKGTDKAILLDTGGDGRVLLANMRKLEISPREIDAVFISHTHRDHVGGLHYLLKENRQITTYLPGSFPDSFKRDVEKHGSEAISVHGTVKICDGVYSTGELGTAPREQSLVVRTARGLVIVTGCAHPGIERVVRMARERFGGEVLLVLGGFHLTGKSKAEIEAVITGLKKLGVRHVAPCHCTGDAARMLFMQAYSEGFIDAGVGKVIDTEGLR